VAEVGAPLTLAIDFWVDYGESVSIAQHLVISSNTFLALRGFSVRAFGLWNAAWKTVGTQAR